MKMADAAFLINAEYMTELAQEMDFLNKALGWLWAGGGEGGGEGASEGNGERAGSEAGDSDSEPVRRVDHVRNIQSEGGSITGGLELSAD
ncbi:MAG: hypothetical protein ACREDR_08890 [Blastocatellia bacterium]